MRTSTNKPVRKIRLIFYGPCGAWLLVFFLWKLAALRIGKELILPAPERVLAVLLNLVQTPEFWRHFFATLHRGLVGFLFSYFTGVAFGLCAGLNSHFNQIFRPVLVTMRSTPSMSFILLALIWFKSDAVAIFVTFFVVFPLVTQNVLEGISQVDPALLEMAEIFRVKPGRVLRKLYLPAILPFLAAGAAAGLGITWKVMIAAEVMAVPRWGMGTRMDTARTFLNTSEVFAWTAVVVFLGYLFDRALDYITKHLALPWQKS
ncbi:MAG TPA: ABC transporter permease subunit [Firmicutes bacterium]|nr:ABC transporter permease subunit [Bacillota bacterium]